MVTHLVAEAGDATTICGLATRRRKGQAPGMPYFLAFYVPTYRESRAARGKTLDLCPTCEAGVTEVT